MHRYTFGRRFFLITETKKAALQPPKPQFVIHLVDKLSATLLRPFSNLVSGPGSKLAVRSQKKDAVIPQFRGFFGGYGRFVVLIVFI